MVGYVDSLGLPSALAVWVKNGSSLLEGWECLIWVGTLP